MLKRICILILLLSLIVPCATFAATEWQSGQRHNWLRLNGRAGALTISGASVGATDTLECRSGNTVEFFYAVLTGVSQVWPLTGGGITGFALSSPSATTFIVDTRELKGTDIDQLRTLTGGNTPYASDSSVTPLMTQHTSAYTTSAGLTAYVQSQVSAYPNASQVTSWIGAGTSTFLTGNTAPSLGTVKNEVADGVSVYTLQTAHSAAGAPGTTSGVSIVQKLLGVTPYSFDATSGLAGVTNLRFQGSLTGVSVSVGGDTVYVTASWQTGFAWDEAKDSPGLSVWSGVSTPPIQLSTNVSVQSVVVSSKYANANSGVSVEIFYNASASPTSGNSAFNLGQIGKPAALNSYTNVVSGITEFAKDGWLQFMVHTAGTGVSNVAIMVYGRTKADGK